MTLKSNNSFSLTETLITVSILSTLVIFIFRALNTCLNAARFSQNISTACFMSEFKLWEAELKAKETNNDFMQNGKENINGREFSWSYGARKIEDTSLLRINLKTSWDEKARNQEYSLNFYSYFYKTKIAQ